MTTSPSDTPSKCDAPNGYHIFGEGESCECGERKRIVWPGPEAESTPLYSNESFENIKGCARCGGDHHIRFREFQNPVVIGDAVLTHWSVCPTQGEPLLMRLVERPPWEASQP